MPPRVDFYVLPETLAAARFACAITARARREGLMVHIQAASRDEALELNDLLWTFNDISFVPHCLADEDRDPAVAPVVIGWAELPPRTGDLLINLDEAIPAFASGFARIVEAVPGDSARRGQSRERWRQYKEMGCEPQRLDYDAGKADA